MATTLTRTPSATRKPRAKAAEQAARNEALKNAMLVKLDREQSAADRTAAKVDQERRFQLLQEAIRQQSADSFNRLLAATLLGIGGPQSAADLMAAGAGMNPATLAQLAAATATAQSPRTDLASLGIL